MSSKSKIIEFDGLFLPLSFISSFKNMVYPYQLSKLILSMQEPRAFQHKWDDDTPCRSRGFPNIVACVEFLLSTTSKITRIQELAGHLQCYNHGASSTVSLGRWSITEETQQGEYIQNTCESHFNPNLSSYNVKLISSIMIHLKQPCLTSWSIIEMVKICHQKSTSLW